jgi:hypothetical protein
MRRVVRQVGRMIAARRLAHPELRVTEEDRRWITTLHDTSVPLPQQAEAELTGDNPRLRDLRERYAALDLPALAASRWSREAVDDFLDLRFFRGETLITWHYRELRRVSELKYFVFARHVADHDQDGLLARLGEDGMFGCWTFSYPGYGRVSRDLLESVTEIGFLERRLEISRHPGFRVLDIGAGYGRLAHRMATAYPELGDYCCVDAVPESTFVSDWYLAYRDVQPPARVVALDEVEQQLEPGTFDLAVNVHSFPEMPYAAVEWWLAQVERLQVPRLLIVPNEPTALMTLEPDGSRRDFLPLVERAGYRLEHREPLIADPAVRGLLRLDDHFHLFALR